MVKMASYQHPVIFDFINSVYFFNTFIMKIGGYMTVIMKLFEILMMHFFFAIYDVAHSKGGQGNVLIGKRDK
jgi:hypothetical protein